MHHYQSLKLYFWHLRSLEVKWCINKIFRWRILTKNIWKDFRSSEHQQQTAKCSIESGLFHALDRILFWVHPMTFYRSNQPTIFYLTCSRSRFRTWPVNFTRYYPTWLLFNWHRDPPWTLRSMAAKNPQFYYFKVKNSPSSTSKTFKSVQVPQFIGQ